MAISGICLDGVDVGGVGRRPAERRHTDRRPVPVQQRSVWRRLHARRRCAVQGGSGR